MNLNSLFHAMQITRGSYQMTIGDAVAEQEKHDSRMPMRYEDGKYPYLAHSYRGFYEDLAFEDGEGGETSIATTVGDLLAELRRAWGAIFQGYKGGEFPMKDTTPIWRSEYGESSGIAWDRMEERNDVLVILTREVAP